MDKRVEVESEQEVFRSAFFSIKEARLRYERYDGEMSEPVTRLNFDRGDSVAALLHDPQTNMIVLVEQFRFPAYTSGHGWLLELPAGVFEKDTDGAEVASMRRELIEETGYTVGPLKPISTFFVSPGGSSERIFLYYGEIVEGARDGDGGGVVSEGENIRIVTMPLAEALRKVDSGEIVDAKTIIALQWLARQKASPAM